MLVRVGVVVALESPLLFMVIPKSVVKLPQIYKWSFTSIAVVTIWAVVSVLPASRDQ